MKSLIGYLMLLVTCVANSTVDTQHDWRAITLSLLLNDDPISVDISVSDKKLLTLAVSVAGKIQEIPSSEFININYPSLDNVGFYSGTYHRSPHEGNMSRKYFYIRIIYGPLMFGERSTADFIFRDGQYNLRSTRTRVSGKKWHIFTKELNKQESKAHMETSS